MSEGSSSRNQLVVIDYLKASAILLVLVGHSLLLAANYDNATKSTINLIGDGGVFIFFFTSGFLATYTLKKPLNAKKYVFSRFSRIYPLYLIAVLISIPVVAEIQLGPKLLYPFMLQIFLKENSGFLWYVPAIFGLFILFAAYHRSKPIFIISLTLLIPYLLFIHRNKEIFCGVLFFVGVFIKRMPNVDIPKNIIVDKIADATYPLYLFQMFFLTLLLTISNNVFLLFGVYLPAFVIATLLIQHFSPQVKIWLHHHNIEND